MNWLDILHLISQAVLAVLAILFFIRTREKL